MWWKNYRNNPHNSKWRTCTYVHARTTATWWCGAWSNIVHRYPNEDINLHGGSIALVPLHLTNLELTNSLQHMSCMMCTSPHTCFEEWTGVVGEGLTLAQSKSAVRFSPTAVWLCSHLGWQLQLPIHWSCSHVINSCIHVTSGKLCGLQQLLCQGLNVRRIQWFTCTESMLALS